MLENHDDTSGLRFDMKNSPAIGKRHVGDFELNLDRKWEMPTNNTTHCDDKGSQHTGQTSIIFSKTDAQPLSQIAVSEGLACFKRFAPHPMMEHMCQSDLPGRSYRVLLIASAIERDPSRPLRNDKEFLARHFPQTIKPHPDWMGLLEAGEGGRTLDIHVGNVTLYH